MAQRHVPFFERVIFHYGLIDSHATSICAVLQPSEGPALKNPNGVLNVGSDRCTVSAGRKVKMETPGRGNT